MGPRDLAALAMLMGGPGFSTPMSREFDRLTDRLTYLHDDDMRAELRELRAMLAKREPKPAKPKRKAPKVQRRRAANKAAAKARKRNRA
ncbi:MAG: hypothetical protein V4530_05890 [Pseudomonadota bacterium]